MAAYEAVIGLECHVELSTASKMFCGCRNDFGGAPNTNVCPVCLGLPGLAPGARTEGDRVHHADRPRARTATIAPRSLFHRKNYFYPDMPKNYQISQYDLPICVGGHLDVEVDGRHAHDRHHARAHGGGHRQDHARGRSRPHRPGRLRARRLQPRRRPARRDRERARHPLGRGGARVPRPSSGRCSSRSASRTCGWRRARSGATRTSRPPGRGADARDEGRDQEHELDPFARARAAVRGGAAARSPRRAASRSCRRRVTSTRRPGRRTRCARRRRRSTTATSPSRT